jgi:hypothetical protein
MPWNSIGHQVFEGGEFGVTNETTHVGPSKRMANVLSRLLDPDEAIHLVDFLTGR